MKKISSALVISLLTLFLFSLPVESAPKKSGPPQARTALVLDNDTRLDCNNLEMFVYNDGNFAYDREHVLGKTDGLYFPRGTKKTMVYSAGVWFGAIVDGNVRVAIAEYSSEFGYGPMQGGTFVADSPEFRVYKVGKNDTPASNPDYANWPADQGAPVDNNGDPLILGDQMTWSVFNDADASRHLNDAGGTLPLGIEIQQSAFGYARTGALANAYFLKFKIINKGGNNLQDAYVSIWVDPDLGDASDDLVGCDTLLGLGYCYNDGWDLDYGTAPPAVGFDFLQGPIVPGLPSDTAYVSGEPRPGFRNLGMMSFNKYINGTDPTSSLEAYGYMRGLIKSIMGPMEPMINPITNQVTTYAVSGDPVTWTGWTDEAAADRRLMLSSGPFDMVPGDTQEVVVAVLVAQGSDPFNAVSALRQTDSQIQQVYDGNFGLPNPNKAIVVNSRGRDQAVDIFWNSSMVGDVLTNSVLNEEFHFEGYNVYQGVTSTGPWKKIATYDIEDEVALIYGDVLNPDIGAIERVVVQNGSNSGLRSLQIAESDAFTHLPLQNGTTYYYGVSGYYFDVNHMIEFTDQFGNLLGYLTPTLETPVFNTEVTPVSNPGVLADTAYHLMGQSDGMVIIEWIDTSARTGHDYRVSFAADNTWSLVDLATGAILLSLQQNQSGDFGYPVIDGFMPRVFGPNLGVKSVAEISNAYGHFWPPDNVNFSQNSTGDWYMDPQGDHSLRRYSWQGGTNHDFEIRITNTAHTHILDFFGAGDYSSVLPYLSPIEIWDIGVSTPENPTDDRQIAYMNLDDGDEFSTVDWGDGLYLWDIDYAAIPWTQPGWNTGDLDPDLEGLHMGRFRFMDVSGEYPFVPAGTIVRITTNKPNSSGDVFEFSTGFECGDIDQSSQVNLSDVVFLVNYLFANGAAPASLANADVDCSGSVRITDCVYMVNYIFLSGSSPCAACFNR